MDDNYMQKIYNRWKSALDRAGIPEDYRHMKEEDMVSMISGTKENTEGMAIGIFNNVKKWGQSGWCFIIDGDRSMNGKTPAEIRRGIGFSILQNGITYACQSPDYCPPYGLYVDYKRVVSNLMNKERGLPFVENMCEQAFLFISEIYLSSNSSQIMRDIMAFKMDEIIRKRKDDGLVTILSFSRPCMDIFKAVTVGNDEIVGPDRYGEEIMNMVSQCGNNKTSIIKELKIARLSI